MPCASRPSAMAARPCSPPPPTARARFDAGGKLLAFGNGGSATDATDLVADLRSPHRADWPGRPALDLTEDPGILTAIANDVGIEEIFQRQVIAYGGEHDIAVALSTSGSSLNLIEALIEARRRGLQTIAMVGYDGGRIAAEELADHVIVSRSQHIPRIQEAQASAYHVFRELIEIVMSTAGAIGMRRARIRVEGTVQGVGFRPFVYRLASELELTGFVRNDERGVVIEAEGAPARIDSLVRRLRSEAPPLAIVLAVDGEDVAVRGGESFEILTSPAGAEPAAMVSADFATCDACLAELRDPADRRYRYPFANCTDCGPRFTIVRGVPYDRPQTTMATFEMCAACMREYDDPLDRRFHAQPNACPECGPRASLADRAGRVLEPAEGEDAISVAAAALRGGRIVAVKGLGGFHLACRADDEAAVSLLRARKHREDKPFARDGGGPCGRARPGRAEPCRGGAPRRPRPADPDRAAPRGRPARHRALGRARPLRARCDAPVHAPSPPPPRRRGRPPGDDVGQPLRRADRLPRRRRAAEAGRGRRRLPAPRPADPHAHR